MFPKLTWCWTNKAKLYREQKEEEEKRNDEFQRTNRVTAHAEWFDGSAFGLLVEDPPALLPRIDITPGVVDPTVTAADLRSPAFIKKRRNVPESEKRMVFQRYDIPWARHSKFEVDHLIPLCLGGQNSISNLWPEPWSGTWGAHAKDRLEVYLHKQVNAGKMPLATAQAMISTNWTNAFVQVGLKPGIKTTLFKLTHRAVK